MTTKLPQIPSYDGSNTAEVIDALKEALEVRVGRRGDALDAGVTFRDLTALGLAEESESASNLGNLSSRVNVRSNFLTGDRPTIYDPTTDFTTPPAPTDLKAVAVFDTVFLSWSMSGFPNQSYWEIWRAFVNDLSAASLIGTSNSQFFTDVVGDDKTVYYWVRTVSAAGVKSAWNSSFGTEVKTGIDPRKLIAAIEGEILESSLSEELATRISDANDQARITIRKLTKEVQDRIAAVNAESAARTAAIQQEAAARAQALLDEAVARGTAITTETNLRTAADDALAQQITTLSATAAGTYATIAALQTEQTARADGDSAQATARETLAAQLRGNYTGTDVTALTTGLVYSERQARVSADGALASRSDALEATVNNPTTGLVATRATLINDYYTKAGTDSAISTASSDLTSTFNNTLSGYVTNATLTTNYYTKSATDSAISAATQNLVSSTTLNNTLGSYVTNATLTNNYLTATDTNNAIAAATSNLVSTTSLNNALGSYVTNASLTTGYYTKTQTDSAISAATLGLVSQTTLNSTLNSYVTTATLTNDYYTKTGTDGAISLATSTLTANFNNTLTGYATTAAVQQNYFAKADGQALQGQYTFKIDLNGYVTGFGLASTVVNGTPSSAFIVRADKFAIVDPSSSMGQTNNPSPDTVPFAVSGGSVYIKNAFIADASISDAKIGSVAAKKITAGYVTASIAFNGSQVYGASLYSGGTTSTSYDGQGNVIGFTANNPTFKVEGGNVEVVSANFKVKTLATATSTFTPFQVVNGVVYMDTAFIRDGTITTAQIQNASINNAQIVSISADKITSGSIDAGIITIDGVTLDTYYDSSIQRNRLRIKDLAVTTAKINDLAVTTGKIDDLAVSTLKIAGNAITQPQVYTTVDLYINQPINNTFSGVTYTEEFVGPNQGDHEYLLVEIAPFEFDYVLTYVGPYQGDYILVPSYSTPTFTGGIAVMETPIITVGVDATAAVQIVYYATLDAGTSVDAGQHLFMLLDTGSGYRLVAKTTVGTRTSGGNTYAAIPIAMTFTARNVATAKVRILTGTRRVDLTPGTGSNPSWLRNSTVSFMGVKR